MFSGKARIGLLVPAQNVAVEEDFARWLPDGVCFHTNRLYLPPGQGHALAAVLESMNEHVGESARLLAKAPIDVVAFACTSGTFQHGLAYDQDMRRRIEEATGGLRAVTASEGVIAALRALGAQRIGVTAPYPPAINERLVGYLTDAGFDVVSFEPCSPADGAIDAVSPVCVRAAVERVVRQAAGRIDAVFVSCTALSIGTMIDDLERRTGRVVVTSNQALLWQCLDVLGIGASVAGAGSLLRHRTAQGAARMAHGVIQ